MSVAILIEESLRAALDPLDLEIVNESASHRGHAGDDGSGESHFRITIVSARFVGKTRIECHRMVWATLDSVLAIRPHSVSIKAFPPEGRTAED